VVSISVQITAIVTVDPTEVTPTTITSANIFMTPVDSTSALNMFAVVALTNTARSRI
jgi:hypothetical protein